MVAVAAVRDGTIKRINTGVWLDVKEVCNVQASFFVQNIMMKSMTVTQNQVVYVIKRKILVPLMDKYCTVGFLQ